MPLLCFAWFLALTSFPNSVAVESQVLQQPSSDFSRTGFLLYLEGKRRHRNGDHKEAIADCKKGLSLEPATNQLSDLTDLIKEQAVSDEKNNLYDRAAAEYCSVLARRLELFEEWRELKWPNFDFHHAVSLMHSGGNEKNRGNYEKAIVDCKIGLRKMPVVGNAPNLSDQKIIKQAALDEKNNLLSSAASRYCLALDLRLHLFIEHMEP